MNFQPNGGKSRKKIHLQVLLLGVHVNQESKGGGWIRFVAPRCRVHLLICWELVLDPLLVRKHVFQTWAPSLFCF